jgi:phosphonate transport system ATP-binding protein
MLSPNNILIGLDRVSVTYPSGVTALHPTSIEFRSGEFTVLVGASGAGKSTLLRCLNHLNEPSTGSLTVDGLGTISDARSLRQHRRRTGMIFQQHQLIGRHSALQNVLMGRIAYYPTWRSLWPLPRKDRAFALHCLERVGLLPKAMERVDSLSGGQQQRVGIARAVAQQPNLILADEPVASLDPATAHRILTLIKRICTEDSIAAIVSLHQVDLAREFADRIVAIANGHIVFDGTPGKVSDDDLKAIYERGSSEPSAVSDVRATTIPATLPVLEEVS